MRSRSLLEAVRGALLAIGLLAAGATTAAAADITIMVATWRGCEEACEGFRDEIAGSGLDAEIVLRDADRDAARIPAFASEARERQVDLVLTWGTTVSVGFAQALADADGAAIPQVFTVVADPVGAGLVESLENSGRPNITGTYNRVPEAVNIDTIRAYMPGFSRLGLIYNENEPNSALKRDELAELAGALGFELVARALPLGDDGKPRPEDLAAEAAALKAAGVEFVYLGSSSFLRAHGRELAEATRAAGLPLLSPYEEMVRSGEALISVAARYHDVGRLAAQQALRILRDGASAGELPVARVTGFAVVINLGVARALGRFPPIGLLQVAETVN